MKNTLTDLNNHLFEALERLQEAEKDELEAEIDRAQAIKTVAMTIIDNGRLSLEAKKYMDEYGKGDSVCMPLLGIEASAKK